MHILLNRKIGRTIWYHFWLNQKQKMKTHKKYTKKYFFASVFLRVKKGNMVDIVFYLKLLARRLIWYAQWYCTMLPRIMACIWTQK